MRAALTLAAAALALTGAGCGGQRAVDPGVRADQLAGCYRSQQDRVSTSPRDLDYLAVRLDTAAFVAHTDDGRATVLSFPDEHAAQQAEDQYRTVLTALNPSAHTYRDGTVLAVTEGPTAAQHTWACRLTDRTDWHPAGPA